MGTRSLVEHFAVIEDPRRGRISHDLVEMLVIVTCALFAEVESFVDIAQWARVKEPWLRRFLRLEGGLPSHDTLNRVFRLLDPKAFEAAFRAWTADVMGAFAQVALDGKSLRGAGRTSPVHLVGAFATDLGLALGQTRVADKSNEITAIPALLRALELRGALVSIDAMGCQREIAREILDRGADYLLAVKANQANLHQAVQDTFVDEPQPGTHEQVLRGHGRQVIQMAEVIENTGQVDTATWPGCRSLGRITSVRISAEAASAIEQRYYISSAALDAEAFAAAVRRHWAIENGLHWSLDVILREDACVVKKDHAPQNLAIMRRLLLNVLRQDTAHPKKSLRLRRKMAGWDDDERMRLLGLAPL